ncbi:tripartite tricarboxylate transporter TctB family protein [Palleronia sp. LCG004]|uniref:tripartite tricarboxylate transporter TctB family protein n=1 Tax=Palleronia sp. LCG004 TaxID=3079304 RepID=UPI002943CFFB|nr:tripartite tricarboxylate transporter TctB family protein [Palleronia sp. LCG004]WOI55476.1 tripartite tricarboxylate transporter TctB family protein [Palleronia sp. LCG004]
MRVTDLTLGLLTILAGIAIYISAMDFSVIPGQSYGAGTMPRAVAFATVGTGAFIAIKALLARGRLGVRFEDWVRNPRSLARIAMILGLIVFYILAAPILGFAPTAFAILLVAMLCLGTGPLIAVPVSLVATLAIQQSFGRLLLVPLPRSDFLSFLW